MKRAETWKGQPLPAGSALLRFQPSVGPPASVAGKTRKPSCLPARHGDRQAGRADQGRGARRRELRPALPVPRSRYGLRCLGGHLPVPHSDAKNRQPPWPEYQVCNGKGLGFFFSWKAQRSSSLPLCLAVGSPLQGLFYRTLHLLENGVKPVFVLDGRPPERKQLVLAKRAAVSGTRREAADSAAGEAPPRLPRQDVETLLSYLGVPCVQAPAEAEATCAALVKSGDAWCTATEDMDALPFGSLRLLRHLHVRSGDLEEISLPVILQKLGMTQEQFVDLCILLGCDYCGKIRGLGPKKALKLLKQHGSIEQVLQNIDPQKHPLPDDNWHLEETRQLFLQPEVADPSQVVLEWREPDEEGLVQFLAHEKHMNESRVRRRMEKWREANLKQTQPQLSGPGTKRSPRKQKMEDFFQVKKRHNKARDGQPSRKRRTSPAALPGERQDAAVEP